VIDFRYHLVSIIAVFLALAIGLAIGANLLPEATEAALKKAANTVTSQNKSLSQQVKNLQQQDSANQNFAQAAAGRLLGHLLTGQRVVLVTAPNSDGQVVSGVTAAVQQAGGSVTGQVALQAQFFDSSDATQSKLNQLAQSLAPDAGVSLDGPRSGDAVAGQEQAARVISAAIVSKDGIGLTPTQDQAVLGGFGQGGYLQISHQPSGSTGTLAAATLAIVVAPSAPPALSNSSPANLALIAVAEQLKAGSEGTVLVASLQGSGPGSVISAVAGQGKVSTVDDADKPVGEIITVQALWELLNGHAPTSYGVGPGSAPSPAPTPSVSPTSTATTHTAKKKT
jgi:biopolymer transport protein ExbD